TQFQGAAKAFQSSLGNLWVLLIIAIAVVYIVLGILYESYIHPLTILSGLPSAGFGALVTLLLFGVDLNIYAFVGMIMLIGIVEKNAIMQIDFPLEAERGGRPSDEAMYQGCPIRSRPIPLPPHPASSAGPSQRRRHPHPWYSFCPLPPQRHHRIVPCGAARRECRRELRGDHHRRRRERNRRRIRGADAEQSRGHQPRQTH